MNMGLLLDSIPPLQKLVAALATIIALIVVWAVIRIINDSSNDLEWLDAIASRGVDGRQHLDLNKCGQTAGIVMCVMTTVIYITSPKMDAGGIALVLAPVLAYLGAVGSFAASLRAKQGSVETTRTFESPTPAKMTEKTVLTAAGAPPEVAPGARYEDWIDAMGPKNGAPPWVMERWIKERGG